MLELKKLFYLFIYVNLSRVTFFHWEHNNASTNRRKDNTNCEITKNLLITIGTEILNFNKMNKPAKFFYFYFKKKKWFSSNITP